MACPLHHRRDLPSFTLSPTTCSRQQRLQDSNIWLTDFILRELKAFNNCIFSFPSCCILLLGLQIAFWPSVHFLLSYGCNINAYSAKKIVSKALSDLTLVSSRCHRLSSLLLMASHIIRFACLSSSWFFVVYHTIFNLCSFCLSLQFHGLSPLYSPPLSRVRCHHRM